MPTRKLICAYCGKEIKPLHHRVTVYNPVFRRELKWQYYHGDCYTEKILKDNDCYADEIKVVQDAYKAGALAEQERIYKNKIGILRAVKVLSEEMQDVAKKAGYKPDDVLFITMEKIEGSIVEWQIKNGLVIKKVY
jgi:hypothetical protein